MFVPVHILPEVKWRDLGKHISNTIMIKEQEKIVASLILKDKNKNVVLFTKNGLIKQVALKDFEVSRYSKPMVAIKLKDNDELINADIAKDEVLIVTNNGFALRFNTSEIPVVGTKASGVKGINLKDDYVSCTTLFLKRESDGKICGSISIRHELNDFLFNFGGHIGYSVTPSERGKGYAKLQLKMALEIAKNLEIEKCLITADVENIASNKTIISEGGVLENTIMRNNDPLNRYWINLK